MLDSEQKFPDQTIRLSYPFDRFLWLESESLDSLVDELVKEIDSAQPIKIRARKKDAEEKLYFFVKVLLLNLLLLHKWPRKTLLAIPKGSGAFSNSGRYSQPLLSYRTFKEGFDGLENLHYLNVVTKGHWDKELGLGEVARIAATHKLTRHFDKLFPQSTIFFSRHPNEEALFHKDKNKKAIDYKDTSYSIQARENLRLINACLNRHWYDLELTNQQFNEFYKAIEEKRKRNVMKAKKRPNRDISPAVINFSERSLYRVFNNGSIKLQKHNFKQGGRFYGGWWEQIPSDYRRYITINQKHTVEMDYSNLHPHMLYAMEGLKLESDAYEFPNIPRKYAKKAFNQLLNGTGRTKAPKGFKEAGIKLTWKQVQEAVRKRHQVIEGYFNTGYGLNLQWQDAQILERVLLHFADRNYPCLPIHDSIIIHYALKDELGTIMVQAYQEVLGQTIPLKTDDNYAFFIERNLGQGEATDSIEKIIEQTLSSQHERRWLEWVSR